MSKHIGDRRDGTYLKNIDSMHTIMPLMYPNRCDEVWADWLRQENEYAVSDRKSMEAGGGKYLNFIAIVLRKK